MTYPIFAPFLYTTLLLLLLYLLLSNLLNSLFQNYLVLFTEGLKNFPRKTNSAKSQIEQISSMPGLAADRNGLSKLVSLNPGVNSPPVNISQHMGSRGASPSGSAQAALAISNYQNVLMRKNSMNSNSQQEASSSFSNPNQNGYMFPGSPNIAVGGFQQRPMFQVQQNHQQSPSHSGGQAMQQHMIQQLLQDMNNGGGGPKPSVSGQSGASGSMGRDGLRYGISASGTSPRPPAVPTRSNSFKGASRSDSSAGGGTGNVGVENQKAATGDLPHLCDDIVQDIASEFTGNCFFENDELEEGMGFGWKA